MGVRRERHPVSRIGAQARQAAAPIVRLLKCLVPHIVDEFRCVEPGLLLRLERDVRPRLVRMTRKKNAFGDSKACVMLGELFRIDHSSDLIAHRSGKAGWLSVVSRYSAPAEPPVPVFVPMVR